MFTGMIFTATAIKLPLSRTLLAESLKAVVTVYTNPGRARIVRPIYTMMESTKSTQEEVVDDSEPEREAQRKRDRDARKKTSPRRICQRYPTYDVIELTDEESVTGDTSSNPDIVEILSPLKSKFVKAPLENSVPSSPLTVSPSPDLHIHTIAQEIYSKEAQSDNESQAIDFTRFAYGGPAPRAGPSREGSTLNTTTESKPVPKKRAVAHRFSADFSDAELSYLSKCVSCDIRWTTRKTGVQKMTHIQSCAKKHSFTDETVRVLIRKEIDSVTEHGNQANGPKRGKGKSQVVELDPPKTFFEDVIADAAPKKKGRRVQVNETVKSVTTARNVILDRARTVLGSTLDHSTGPEKLGLAYTQSIGQHNRGIHEPLPSTQIFGQSALARNYTRHMNLIVTDPPTVSDGENESDIEMPAYTQAFAPSKLGAACTTGNKRSQQEDHIAPSLSPLHAHATNRPLNNKFTLSLQNHGFIDNLMNTSVREVAPYRATKDEFQSNQLSGSFRKKINTTSGTVYRDDTTIGILDDVREQPINFRSDNNDAYLHFKSRVHTVNKGEGLETTPLMFDTGTTSKLDIGKSPEVKKTPRKRLECPSPSANPIEITPKKKATTTCSKRKMPEKNDDLDEEWEKLIKDRIVQDASLYLRILCYEPIHFDVFLKFATDEVSCSGKLKGQLRSFLDKQAINFYGADSKTRK